MKILYITTEGFDTPSPNNQMAMTMIDKFLASGFMVHLIESSRKKINADIPQILENREGFSYDIVQRKVIDKTKFVKRFIDEAKYSIQCWKKWRKIKDNDIVFLQSCPTVVFTILLLKLFNKKPIVYNVYDVFPGHAYDIGVIKSKLIYNVFKIMQKITYKASTIITVLSEDMKKKIIEQGVEAEKIRIIPPWYNENEIKEIKTEDNKFIQKYKLNTNKFYVQFAGTIGYIFDYKTVIEVAKLLKYKKNIELQIIGDGNTKEKFEREVELCNLENIKFYPLQPLDIVPDVYSACSICFIPLVKGVIGNGVPSKAPLLMACKRVIVNSVEKDSEYYKIFNKNNIGISVNIGDYQGIVDAILYLYKNPEILKQMEINAKTYGEENYTASKNIQKLIDIFYELGEKDN